MNPELHFISRLSDYRVKSILTRIMIVSGTAVLFLFMAVQVTGDAGIEVTIREYFQTIFFFNFITESNVFFDHFAERYLPIPEKIGLRLFLHAIISLLLGGIFLGVFIITDKMEQLLLHPLMQLMILFGLIFIFILILVSVTVRIIEKWVFSIRQLEELKNLKLAGDYHSLQAQLNPHFLFNSLSVLKSMIKYEPEAAVQFTQNFTDVYRYVLGCKDKITVKLKDELEFIEAYVALHMERMGSALRVETEVDNIARKKNIPPLALQQLVENALKHNTALKDEPLVIKIYSSGDTIIVINNLKPKDSDFSKKTGLSNLVERYSILTEIPVNITSDEHSFKVEIPLL